MKDVKKRLRLELDHHDFKSVSMSKALRITEVVLRTLDYEMNRSHQYMTLMLGKVLPPPKEKSRGKKKVKRSKRNVSKV